MTREETYTEMYAAHLSVAKVPDVEDFIEARARLQRLSDRKFFMGWLTSLSHSHAVLRMNSSRVSGGDVFSVEVSGSEHTAVFLGAVTKIFGERVDLKVASGVTLMPPKEAARFRKVGYQGRLSVEGTDAPFAMTDMSAEGMGLLSPYNVPVNAQLDFELVTPTGTIRGQGEVRYCKGRGVVPEIYRVGVQFTRLDRIERARWRQLRAS